MSELRRLDRVQFIKRTVVAVIGGGAIIGIIYAPPLFAVTLFVILAIVGFAEASRLVYLAADIGGAMKNEASSQVIVGPMLGLLSSPLLIFLPDEIMLFALVMVFASLRMTSLSHLFYPLQVLAGFCAAIRLVLLGNPDLFMCLFVAIWSVDIGAYLIGMKFGRRPLAPIISPRKTWEGAIGGLIAGTISGAAFGSVFGQAGYGAILGIAAGTVGQLGDLAESALKRSAGVKDSSNLLPGHGGILDRFDSFILTTPAFYLFLA